MNYRIRLAKRLSSYGCRKRTICAALATLLSAVQLPASAGIELLAKKGDVVPDGNGEVNDFNALYLNDAGQVMTQLNLANTAAGAYVDSIYVALLSAGSGMQKIVRQGDPRPDGGTFDFRSPEPETFNDLGEIGFVAGPRYIGDLSGVRSFPNLAGMPSPDGEGTFTSSGPGSPDYLTDDGSVVLNGNFGVGVPKNVGVYIYPRGGGLVQVTRKGDPIPGSTTGETFGNVAARDYEGGNVLFAATIDGAPWETGSARYLGNGGLPQLVVRKGDPLPDGSIFDFAIGYDFLNTSGQVSIAGRSSAGYEALFRTGVGEPLVEVVRQGQTYAGIGKVEGYTYPQFNERGNTAFFAYMDGYSKQGLYLGDGIDLVKFIDTTDALPNGAPAVGYNGLGDWAFNDSDNVAFATGNGIYVANGNDVYPIVQVGDTLAGKVVTGLGFRGVSGLVGLSTGFNNAGQIAFSAKFGTDRAAFLYTPDLHWVDTGPGNWDELSGWTLTQSPGVPSDVFLDAAGGAQLVGPSVDRTIGSLLIGAGNSLSLSGGGGLNVTGGTRIEQGGRLSGTDPLGGGLVNSGLLTPGNSPGYLSISGDYTQSGVGVLGIELAGLLAGSEYDVLAVSGQANLAGTIEVSLLNGFLPSADDVFDILTASVIDGDFSTWVLPALSGGLSWEIAVLTDQIGTTDVLRLRVLDSTPSGGGGGTPGIPAPGAIWLVGLGLGGIRLARLRSERG